MRLLVVSLSLPFPPTDGGKIRVLNLLRQAAGSFDITLVALETEVTDREAVADLSSDSLRVVLVPQNPVRVPSLTARSVLRAMTARTPLTAAKYDLPELRAAVVSELAGSTYDVVHLEMIHCAHLLPLVRQMSRAAVVLSTQNVDSDVWRRAADHQPTAWRRWAFRWQANVFRAAEERIGSAVNGISVASSRDAELFGKLVASTPIETIDNGVDLDGYTPDSSQEEAATCIYTGSYDWLPNADAVAYFCQAVWSRIRTGLPESRFLAVGKEPTDAMRAFDGIDGIEIVGRVPEIHPYLRRGTVYVVPLRIGGGSRLKILEAMGMGKAIVSTSIGCEGLDVVPGRDLVVADSPYEFAEQVIRLIRDHDARRALGIAARARVEQRYGWVAIGARMNAFYERVAGAALHQPVPGSR